MTKTTNVLRIPCLLVLAFMTFLGLATSSVHADTYQYTIEAGSYEMVDAGDGYQEIRMEGFGQLLDPGKPKLPSRIFVVAIPPGARADSVEVVGNGLTELPGTYNITPAPMVSALDATESELEEIRATYDQTVEEAYASDEDYPITEGEFKNQGGYRKYNLVQVRFSPFQYRAKSGRLFSYSSATVTVNYSTASAVSSEEGVDAQGAGLIQDWLPEVEKQASEILENYDEAQGWYPAPAEGEIDSAIGLYEFVIITTEALVDAVQPLVDWEKSKGRTVYVATTTEIQTLYPTSDLQRAMRYWLRYRYPSTEWGITDVCLVGDLSHVPMRYCSPGGAGTSTVPTDLYYAELTDTDSLSWDDDWDGYFGEYGQDTIDFVQEVNVGRIPWSDFATVEAICLKIAEYDWSNYMSGYKNNVLFNMAYFWWDTDGAVLSELLLGRPEFSDMTPYRIYERSVYNPGSVTHRWSTYTANAYMTASYSPFVAHWASSTNYGFVNWLGHGSSVSASYHCGDGLSCWNFIHRDDTTSLDDDYPAIVYSDSCSTAYPDTNSLGRNVMKQGGVAFVGSSRVAYGAHGWNDPSDGNCESLHYEFATRVAGRYGVYTVGRCFRNALYMMTHSWGWDTSWLQAFEWTLFGSPDMRAAAAQPALPNLTYNYKPDWPYPIVPRSAGGATDMYCPVTATLPGNTSDTYLNWSWQNSGALAAPPARLYHYMDGYNYAYTPRTLAAGVSDTTMNWNYGPTIKGGRHTLWYEADGNEVVWESNEYDNCWGRQFVWSPLALSDDTPIYRSAGPDADAWGCGGVYFNNDGFSFYVNSVHPNKWWSAVGVLPYSSAADYDLRLYDIGDYTGSEAGFGGGYLEYSMGGGDDSDFVIVNDNTADAGTYTVGAINSNNNAYGYHIEEATSTKIYAGSNGPYSMSSTAVLDIYEYYMYPAGDYGFKLVQTAGTCDLGMSLYDDETVYCKKTEYMTGGYANTYGDGADEYMRVTIPDEGYHGLVVWKADSSDYAKTSTYNIKVGPCATPSALIGPSPANGATDVSVDTDLDWADSTDTEYYEVWLNEAGSGWVHLGNTETSSWSLPTLNEATHYDWFIAANNICGTRIYVYWDFTTEDNTAPTPNPMTWATEPYETSTSAISMVATTASDPTPPITYYFLFTSSPTGGTGGTSSGYISSTSYTDSGLLTNHQYGYRVYARDGSLNLTSPSGVSYDYTDIETPTGITFGTKTATSIQARSTNTPSGLTRGSSGLYIYNATAGTTSGWKQNNDLWNSTGLAPNTQYGFRATARNGDANQTGWSPTSYTYTLANAPVAASFSNITQTSIRANWTTNGNPAGTEYYCQNLTAGTGSGWTTATNWNSSGLSCGQSYTFRVRARNAEGTATDWVSLGSRSTLPCDEPPVIDDIAFEGCISELCTGGISVTAHDPEGGTLTYAYTPLNGGAIDGSGTDVAFNPPDSGPHPCPYRIEVEVTSSVTGLTDSEVIEITAHLAGDANGSGRVDILDKRLVRDAYGSVPGDANWDPQADVNCSGRVDILDKRVVRDQYGNTGCACP